MSYQQYWSELRQKLITSLSVLAVTFGILCYFSQTLFYYLALPLIQQLPKSQMMIATAVATPLVTPLKFSFMLSLFLCVPIFLYQFWSFVSPALYRSEKRIINLFFIPSVLLFYGGVAFAYFIVFPMVFHFFVKFQPPRRHVITGYQ